MSWLRGIFPLQQAFDAINARRELHTRQPQNVRQTEVIVKIEGNQNSENSYRPHGVDQRFFVDQTNSIVIKR